MPSGKLLRYMVSHRGIDPNLVKVSAITKMKPLESLHDVQKLTGCMTALSRFILQLNIRGLSFFKLLKKQDKFQWTQEAQEAFEDLKKYRTTPPTLVALNPMKTCNSTYRLQEMWLVQQSSSNKGSHTLIARSRTQFTSSVKC
jgi:hypothetical protein